MPGHIGDGEVGPLQRDAVIVARDGCQLPQLRGDAQSVGRPGTQRAACGAADVGHIVRSGIIDKVECIALHAHRVVGRRQWRSESVGVGKGAGEVFGMLLKELLQIIHSLLIGAEEHQLVIHTAVDGPFLEVALLALPYHLRHAIHVGQRLLHYPILADSPVPDSASQLPEPFIGIHPLHVLLHLARRISLVEHQLVGHIHAQAVTVVEGNVVVPHRPPVEMMVTALLVGIGAVVAVGVGRVFIGHKPRCQRVAIHHLAVAQHGILVVAGV